MSKKIILLFVFFFISFGHTSNIIWGIPHKSSCALEDKYKILKIKSKKNIYIIYVERNDSIFKILSKKEIVNKKKYRKIRRNKEYLFLLHTLFPRVMMGIEFPPPGSTGRMGIGYYGIDVPLETEKGIWDLFEATNLKGLYIEKDDIVSD